MKKKSTSQSAPARRSPWLAVLSGRSFPGHAPASATGIAKAEVFTRRRLGEGGFFNLRVLIATVFCLAGIFVAMLGMGTFSSAFAQRRGANTNQDAPGTQTPDVLRMVGPVRLDMDLRDLPWVAPKAEHEEQPLYRHPRPKQPPQTSSGYGTSGLARVQSLLQNIWQPQPTMPGPLLTFEGHNNTCGCFPPDSDGDVGPNHYVEAVNESIKI